MVNASRCSLEQRRQLVVDVVENHERIGVGHLQAALADARGELVGVVLNALEEGAVDDLLLVEERLHPLERVLELPGLELGGEPVAGRVVGGGVRAHPVGEGLDERRALPGAGVVERLAG